MSQVDEVSDNGVHLPALGSDGGGLRNASASTSVWESCPPALTLMPDNSVPPPMSLIPLNL